MTRFSAGFFVRKIRNKGEEKGKEPNRLDTTMIIQLKEMGFSLFEMNEITVQDYVDLVDAYVKVHDIPKTQQGAAASGRRRKGTSQEFSSFFGGMS